MDNLLALSSLVNTSSLWTISIGGFVTPSPPVRPHVTSTGTGRTRRELCGRREEALGLRLVLREAAGTEAGRGRNTCFTAGGCGMRLDVRRLTKSRGRRLNDGRTIRRLLDERTLTERGLSRGPERRQSRMIAPGSARRFGGSRGCVLGSAAWEVWAVETGRRPGASNGALGSNAMSGLGGQHRVDHRIVNYVLGTRSL